ncbi:MAG: hypothetical protein ABIJ96_09900 [Elusimicrobiota bacterium]
MSLKTVLFFLFAVRFGLSSAAQAAVPNSLHHGLAAKEVLSIEALAPAGTAEGMYHSGFKAQQIMQGLQTGDRPAVRAERAAESEQGVPPAEIAQKVKGLKTGDVPLPGRADGKPPAEKGKLDKVLKFVQKWLPIAMLVYGSVNMIINPIGAASGALRMAAVIAAVGTAMLLYKTIKKKG